MANWYGVFRDEELDRFTNLIPFRKFIHQPNVDKSLLPWYLQIPTPQFHRSWLGKQSYYDDPEGKNLLGKLWAVNKYGLFVGSIWGTYHAYYTRNLNIYPFHSTKADVTPFLIQRYVGCLGHYLYPFLACGTLFVVTTYASTKIRGKDDEWNYLWGGLAAGIGMGTWRASTQAGWYHGIAFALIAAFKKNTVDHGFVWFPEIVKEDGEVSYAAEYGWRHSDYPKGYEIVKPQIATA